ncbi:MAG TPA: hypothetical protein DEQ14_07745 [Treponema sp.]|nr:hypothetical protein [Treponema sp.]
MLTPVSRGIPQRNKIEHETSLHAGTSFKLSNFPKKNNDTFLAIKGGLFGYSPEANSSGVFAPRKLHTICH